MPPWLQTVPTVGGWACIAVFGWLLFTGKILLARELAREKAANEELKALLIEAQAANKSLEQTAAKLANAMERVSRKA